MRNSNRVFVTGIGILLGIAWMADRMPPANGALGRALAPSTPQKEEIAKGTIIALKKDLPRFVIGCADGSVLQMQLEVKAVIQRNGSPAEIGDLRLGDQVIVKYRTRDGAHHAYSVQVIQTR